MINRIGQMAIGAIAASFYLSACTQPTSYDVILRGGTIYDGSGETPYVGDVALNGDTIAALGDLGNATAKAEIDVQG
ncbi:MAG: D-aminoacylase, partial [Desulfobulbaceae bacterium]|nr:D-aminoacylase [Desulfobulbaceae bacterium]